MSSGTHTSFLVALCGSKGQVYRPFSSGWLETSLHASAPWPSLYLVDGGTAYAANGNKVMRFVGDDWVEFAHWEMGYEITSIHVIDATHLWALGVEDGIDHFVLFYDGSSWSILKHASLDGFNALWCDATGANVFVAGEGGLIWWRHDDIWDLDYIHPDGTSLFDLDGNDTTGPVAVGDGGLILRRGPMGWTIEDSGTSAALRAVHGPVVAGDAGTVLIHSGDHWEATTSGLDVRLNGVWYGGPDNIWVVGDETAVAHYDGSGWTRLMTHLPGIDFLSVQGLDLGGPWIGGSEGYLLKTP